MSFFGELVNSIGGDKPPAQPVPLRPQSKPASTNGALQTGSKSAPATPAVDSSTRPVYKGTAKPSAPPQASTLKRKAEDISTERPVKLPKPTLQGTSDHSGQKPSKLNGSVTNSPVTAKPTNGYSSTQASSAAAKAPAKPPSKGSYAELMARAKEAQQSKPTNQVGVIKHNQTKEKVKISKLAERRKAEQEKAKPAAPGQGAKLNTNGKVDPRRRSASPVKKGEPVRPKQPQAPKPPLHGPPKPAAAPAPSYKGTMGQAPKKSREDLRGKKPSRYDEYLATDEEDEGDYDEDDGFGDGYSDASSDMEAGFDDVAMEESRAARAALEDDKKELELEERLKREKKARLAALAQKNRK